MTRIISGGREGNSRDIHAVVSTGNLRSGLPAGSSSESGSALDRGRRRRGPIAREGLARRARPTLARVLAAGLGILVVALGADRTPAVATHEGPAAGPNGARAESGRAETAPPARTVLVRSATIWTMGPRGTIEKGDLLVVDGKIREIGARIEPPQGALVIDAESKQVTPGIIDCHSHTAIDGDVNEGTHTVTAEVRIGDVVDYEDVNIYRQLAGGVTTVNALHGSANAIGGQNAVLRWKWGRAASELRFTGAPEGIKFALGENPKQSNWGETSDRYPKTRMGVEESIRSAFLAAKDNRLAWERERAAVAKKNDHRVPPRRDLQLDALNEILDGTRMVHSHCYRADEILMLMRLGDSLGFRVRTFQHVLEGYKVADEMAAHGTGGSTFSDWWAFKIEAYDAIPYNAALMTRRGVLVSINSDSGELARHLNVEAAKSMKFGGLTPVESLALVTINPARQLGIDSRVGSLEPGKDADFVIWSGDPLSVYSIVESTWIEGVKYFDRAEDLAKRKSLDEERARLISRIKNPPRKDGAVPKSAEGAEGAAPSPPPSKPAIAESQVGPVLSEAKPGPVPASGDEIVIVGATVHTVAGADLPGASVLVRGGKIAAVGTEIPIPPGARRFDARGRHLYPSMIDPNTTLGLVEIGSVKGTVDVAETGRINPDIHVEVAVNPASEAIPVTRANGILVALTAPQGALLRGTSALLRLDGWTWEQMTLKAPVAMHLAWPRVTVPTRWWEPKKTEEEVRKEKEEALKEVKNVLVAARAYLRAKQAAARGDAEMPAVDTRLESMAPLVEGRIPIVVEANDLRQIKDAVEWAEKEKLPLILSEGRDAWRVADLLAKKHIPVILGPVQAVPSREDEPYDTAYTAAAKLHEAGVLFALSAGGASNVRILPYNAGMAAAFGLPKEEALRAVTLYPARILGVEDRLGSIEVGKDATLIETDGDPLEMRTQVLAAWIEGREVSLENRHKRLYDEYRNRPLPVAAKR